MSSIAINSEIKTYGKSKAIVMVNGEEIDSFDIPKPKDETNNEDSISTETNTFKYNDIIYSIDITSSNAGTYIQIESEDDSDEIYDFEIFIDNKEDNITQSIEDFKIELYVPTLSYTNTTGAVLYEQTNDKIIPIIDVETEEKFNKYLKDEIIISSKHFLDISSIKETSNKEEIEFAKLKRKDEKRLQGKMNTILPSPIQKFMELNSKVNYLKRIQDKDKVIPIFKWDENSNLDILKNFIDGLRSDYKEIALRVSSIMSFLENIEKIYNLYSIHLILDLNTNFYIDEIKYIILNIQKYSFANIIYLGAQFNTDEISIPRDYANKNFISQNQPLLIYKLIWQDNEINQNIGYGDYCGFDRKTITEMPSGGRATGRVVLSSIDKSMKLLIRRGWSDDDITGDGTTGRRKIGYRHSMQRLLKDIQDGHLDYDSFGSRFMNEEICDADYSLKDYYPDITSPGIIKTLCFRHNVFSIKYNFIKD
ncbi:MAG: hypothetical protein DI602_09735 [Aliarcobacter butzleri]|nr:MAG: hypothetical protein DI602_09735 [Aliarcobacter butzleri]